MISRPRGESFDCSSEARICSQALGGENAHLAAGLVCLFLAERGSVDSTSFRRVGLRLRHQKSPHIQRSTPGCRRTGVMSSAMLLMSSSPLRKALHPSSPLPPALSRDHAFQNSCLLPSWPLSLYLLPLHRLRDHLSPLRLIREPDDLAEGHTGNVGPSPQVVPRQARMYIFIFSNGDSPEQSHWSIYRKAGLGLFCRVTWCLCALWRLPFTTPQYIIPFGLPRQRRNEKHICQTTFSAFCQTTRLYLDINSVV